MQGNKQKATKVVSLAKMMGIYLMYLATLTHCILNRLSHTISWKSPISILGTSGYEIYIFHVLGP